MSPVADSDCRLSLAVDALGVDQHLGFAHDLSDVRYIGAAVGIVAVGDEDHRLFEVASALSYRHGLDDRVVHRGATDRSHPRRRLALRASRFVVQSWTR